MSDDVTLGQAIVKVSEGALEPEVVSIFGLVVDSMMAGQQHNYQMISDFYEDERDRAEIVQRRIKRILMYGPRLGTTGQYEDILDCIHMALYVSNEALDAFRENEALSQPLPRSWFVHLSA